MPKFASATVSLDVEAGAEPLPAKPESDAPFRILVLGDFSGRGNRGEPAAGRLRPYLIDRDNFDQVLGRVRPELELGEHGRGIVLRFRELEDFHPDRIYAQAACFGKLRETRRKLGDPATFAEAAETVKSWSGVRAKAASVPERAPERAPEPPLRPAAMTRGSLLDDIVEATEAVPAESLRRPDDLRAFIDRVVAPHVTPREDPQLTELVAQVDEAAGRLMRAILHHRDFQALEAAWRALFFLTRELETGPQLKVYVLDISKAELAGAWGELRRILVDEAVATPGADPWSLVAGNFTFAQTIGDVQAIAELARIVRAARAAFLAEADPSEINTADAARRWDALRHLPEASWIGLALPRFAAPALRREDRQRGKLCVRGDARRPGPPEVSLGQSGLRVRISHWTGRHQLWMGSAAGSASGDPGIAPACLRGGRRAAVEALRGDAHDRAGCGLDSREGIHAAGLGQESGCCPAAAFPVDRRSAGSTIRPVELNAGRTRHKASRSCCNTGETRSADPSMFSITRRYCGTLMHCSSCPVSGSPNAPRNCGRRASVMRLSAVPVSSRPRNAPTSMGDMPLGRLPRARSPMESIREINRSGQCCTANSPSRT